jgi:hypothetical protein
VGQRAVGAVGGDFLCGRNLHVAWLVPALGRGTFLLTLLLGRHFQMISRKSFGM